VLGGGLRRFARLRFAARQSAVSKGGEDVHLRYGGSIPLKGHHMPICCQRGLDPKSEHFEHMSGFRHALITLCRNIPSISWEKTTARKYEVSRAHCVSPLLRPLQKMRLPGILKRR
jgi:hypothetical protein